MHTLSRTRLELCLKDFPEMESSIRRVRSTGMGATTLAWKFRKYGPGLVAELRWSSLDAHCTRACPGCVVCVIEALGRFPTCIVMNESDENGGSDRLLGKSK